MKSKSSKKSKNRIILLLTIVVLIVLSITIVLADNKRKINKASTPVDRTNIPVAVTVATAVYKPLDIATQYPAVTQPYEEAMLYAQTGGLVTWLNISLGQHVRKRQVLGKLDSRILQNNLEAAAINLRTAQTNRLKLQDDYRRAKDLYENKAGLEVNMLAAKNNYDNAVNSEANAKVQVDLVKKQIDNANIIAPIDGIISAHKIKQGEFVNPSTPIATISNVSRVKATVFVSQELCYRLKTGQSANITSPLFDEETITGKIIFINTVADANHNYQVDLLVNNNGSINLKGGTDVQVSFYTYSQKEALLIPKSALVTDVQQPYVYVAANGKAERKDIRIGVIKDDVAEVLSGLMAGETVITAGQTNLTNGSYISFKK